MKHFGISLIIALGLMFSPNVFPKGKAAAPIITAVCSETPSGDTCNVVVTGLSNTFVLVVTDNCGVTGLVTNENSANITVNDLVDTNCPSPGMNFSVYTYNNRGTLSTTPVATTSSTI